jgi:hypothetical protein
MLNAYVLWDPSIEVKGLHVKVININISATYKHVIETYWVPENHIQPLVASGIPHTYAYTYVPYAFSVAQQVIVDRPDEGCAAETCSLVLVTQIHIVVLDCVPLY